MSVKLPKGLISPKEAKALNQQFVKSRSKEMNKIVEKLDKKPNKKDAISSWFSLEELKDYIAYVESKSKNVNGLRVYLGAYGKKSDAKKSNMSTVFFVPTEPKVGSLQKDGVANEEGGSDITDIEGLNLGQQGDPPSGEYPQ